MRFSSRSSLAVYPIFALLILVGVSAAAIPCYYYCPSGTVLSCTASTSCSSGSYWLRCDDGETQSCPQPCTVYCPNDPSTSCTSLNNQCTLTLGFGVYPTDTISCDGNPPIACPPCPGCPVQ